MFNVNKITCFPLVVDNISISVISIENLYLFTLENFLIRILLGREKKMRKF